MQDELRQAIELAQNGESERARVILRNLTQSNPKQEAAWLWLASVAEDRTERINALRRVLQLNPNNERAKTALEKLGETTPPPSPKTEENLNPLENLLGRKFTWADYAGILLLVVVSCYVIFVLAGGLGGGDNTNENDEFLNPPTLRFTFTPQISATPSMTPTITDTPRPPITEAPPITLAATWTPEPSRTPEPTRTLAPTFTPFPTRTPFITDTPIPTRTRRPSAEVLEPTEDATEEG